MKMLFINARIITPYRILPPGWFLEVTDGKITMLTDGPVDAEHFPGEVIDAEGCYLSPGFIDMHTHGAGGHDFMDGTLDATLAACRTHMHYGTTSIVPTTLSSQRDELVRNLTLIDEAAKITDHMPNILGSHLEGPYFSPAQSGAQEKPGSQGVPAHFGAVPKNPKMDSGTGTGRRYGNGPNPAGAGCYRFCRP